MQNNPLDQLAKVMERLGELAKEEGLELEGFAFVPSTQPGGRHTAQAVFGLTEKVFKTKEELDIDEQFKDLAIRARMESHDEEVKKVEKTGMDLIQTIQNLGSSGGIGLDEPDLPKPEEENGND